MGDLARRGSGRGLDVLVCHCHRVSDTRIVEALAAGADGVRGVMRHTGAGTDCRRCLSMLSETCSRWQTPCGALASQRSIR